MKFHISGLPGFREAQPEAKAAEEARALRSALAPLPFQHVSATRMAVDHLGPASHSALAQLDGLIASSYGPAFSTPVRVRIGLGGWIKNNTIIEPSVGIIVSFDGMQVCFPCSGKALTLIEETTSVLDMVLGLLPTIREHHSMLTDDVRKTATWLGSRVRVKAFNPTNPCFLPEVRDIARSFSATLEFLEEDLSCKTETFAVREPGDLKHQVKSRRAKQCRLEEAWAERERHSGAFACDAFAAVILEAIADDAEAMTSLLPRGLKRSSIVIEGVKLRDVRFEWISGRLYTKFKFDGGSYERGGSIILDALLPELVLQAAVGEPLSHLVVGGIFASVGATIRNAYVKASTDKTRLLLTDETVWMKWIDGGPGARRVR